MTYSVLETIGEVEVYHTYEGTPEEIAQLINLMERQEPDNETVSINLAGLCEEGE